jgi:hypothetical protein
VFAAVDVGGSHFTRSSIVVSAVVFVATFCHARLSDRMRRP